tara:strand:+ start:1283 stop:1510 length:228 start_codon:yes stop_codon:yes gene_type:complete
MDIKNIEKTDILLRPAIIKSYIDYSKELEEEVRVKDELIHELLGIIKGIGEMSRNEKKRSNKFLRRWNRRKFKNY